MHRLSIGAEHVDEGPARRETLAPGVDGDYCRVGEERVVVEGERSGEGEPSEERNGEGEEGARC